jgi:hypothetical protein
MDWYGASFVVHDDDDDDDYLYIFTNLGLLFSSIYILYYYYIPIYRNFRTEINVSLRLLVYYKPKRTQFYLVQYRHKDDWRRM